MSEEIKKEKAKEQTTEEIKKEEPKKEETKKQVKVENKKKSFVTINGTNLHISPKVGVHICNMIREKNIDKAIKMVEEVLAFKRAVKMNNMEIGHRPGKGMMAGRYPQVACGEFLNLLKNLRADALYHEMEIEKSKVAQCYTNVASKPYKRGGARAKRAHVFIKLEQKKEETKAEKKTEDNKKNNVGEKKNG